MANIINSEEEKKSESQEIAPLSQAGGVSGGTTASTPVNAAPSNAPKGSGRFTNIQKYLGANKGAGEQLAGGIQKKSDEYSSGIREGIQSAQNVQQGVQSEQNRVANAGNYAQQIGTDAVGLAGSNLDDVTKLRTGQSDANKLYGQGIQTASNFEQNLNPLDQLGQNLGSEGGRFQALQDVYGGAYKPQYSTGQRRLDQVFLQSQAGDQVQDLQRQIGDTVSQGQQAQSGLNQTMSQDLPGLAYDTQGAQRQILEALGGFDAGSQGALGALYGDLGNSQSERESYLQDYLRQARAEFGSGNLSRGVADNLGLSGAANTADMDLTDYANKNIRLGDNDVTFADAANDEQMARLNALSQLSGTEMTDYDLGKKEGSDVLFNNDVFQSDVAKNLATYEDRFFDKNYNDVNGGWYSPENNYNYNRFEGTDHTVADMIKNYSNQKDRGTGFFGSRGYYDQLADPSSRQQLEQAAGAITAGEAARGMGNRDGQAFQNLLRLFDQQKNQGIKIVGDDQETGGHFNVK